MPDSWRSATSDALDEKEAKDNPDEDRLGRLTEQGDLPEELATLLADPEFQEGELDLQDAIDLLESV